MSLKNNGGHNFYSIDIECFKHRLKCGGLRLNEEARNTNTTLHSTQCNAEKQCAVSLEQRSTFILTRRTQKNLFRKNRGCCITFIQKHLSRPH